MAVLANSPLLVQYHLLHQYNRPTIIRALHQTRTKENREGINFRMKKYYVRNKESVLDRARLYYLRNKSVIISRARGAYLRNKETIEHRRRLSTHNPSSSSIKEALREQRRQYMSQYCKTKKEMVSKYMREYRSNHREIFKVRNRQYYLENKDAISKRMQLYYLNRAPPRKSKNWTKAEHVKEYLTSITKLLHITDPADWYRISRKQIVNVGGGSGLYSAFSSLGKALQFAYPEFHWNESKFSIRAKKSVQRWLRINLELILPENTTIIEDFLHPHLNWEENTAHKMELDIWVPQYNLALEYQGEQHYFDLHCAFGPSGSSAMYNARDMKKLHTCTEKGIRLVTIPYWWDGSKESLAATLRYLLPDLTLKTVPPPPLLPSSLSCL